MKILLLTTLLVNKYLKTIVLGYMDYVRYRHICIPTYKLKENHNYYGNNIFTLGF